MAKIDTTMTFDDALKIMAQDAISNMASGLGTGRDKRSYGTFSRGALAPFNNNLGGFGQRNAVFTANRTLLENMYQFDWLSGKVIDIPVDDALREWRTVTIKDDSALQDEFIKAEEYFKVKEEIEKAWKWARLYGGAGIIIGVDGAGDASTPLDMDAIPRGGLKFFKALDQWHMTPIDIEYIYIDRKNYYQPSHYIINGTGEYVHNSRIILFKGRELPMFLATLNFLWGDSILTKMYDALLNAATSPNIIASLMYESTLDIFTIENLAQLLSSPNGPMYMNNRLNMAAISKSTNNALFIDAKEDYKKEVANLTGFSEIGRFHLEIAAGASDIPVPRLFGKSIGQLNATGDADIINYYDSVRGSQKNLLKPRVSKMDRVVFQHLYGKVPKDYSYEFNKLWQMSDEEQARIGLINAQRDQIYLDASVLTPKIIALDLRDKKTYNHIDDEYIEVLEAAFLDEPKEIPDPNAQKEPQDFKANVKEEADGEQGSSTSN